MAWPPPALPINRTNANPQQDTHPADHNAVNLAVNDLVVRIADPVNVVNIPTFGDAAARDAAMPAATTPQGKLSATTSPEVVLWQDVRGVWVETWEPDINPNGVQTVATRQQLRVAHAPFPGPGGWGDNTSIIIIAREDPNVGPGIGFLTEPPGPTLTAIIWRSWPTTVAGEARFEAWLSTFAAFVDIRARAFLTAGRDAFLPYLAPEAVQRDVPLPDGTMDVCVDLADVCAGLAEAVAALEVRVIALGG